MFGWWPARQVSRQVTEIDGLDLLPGRQPCLAVESNLPVCNQWSRGQEHTFLTANTGNS